MSLVDWALLAIVAGGGLIGLLRGAVRGVIHLVGHAIGAIVALFAVSWFADQLAHLGIDYRLVLLGIVCLVAVTVSAIVRLILRVAALPVGIVRAIPPFGWLDRLLGIVPGLVQGGVAATLLVLALVVQMPSTRLAHEVASSSVGSELADAGSWVFSMAGRRAGWDVHALAAKDVAPGQAWAGTETLPMSDLRVDERAEAEVFEAINARRAEAGVPILESDAELSAIARQHARDAEGADQRQLPPSIPDVADRLAADGRTVFAVGAVMASASSADLLVEALMASPTHQEVVLSASYRAVGIGVIAADDGAAIMVGVFVL